MRKHASVIVLALAAWSANPAALSGSITPRPESAHG